MGEAKHFATKEDVANVKVWALTSVLGALVTLVSFLGGLVVSKFLG